MKKLQAFKQRQGHDIGGVRPVMIPDDAGEWVSRHDAEHQIEHISAQRDELLAALEKYEQAFGEMFAQCCSNPVYDAWGKPVEGLSTLSEAHFIAGKAISHIKGGAE